MSDEKKPGFDKKEIKIRIPASVHQKYREAVEKVYGDSRSGDKPIRSFILNFIKENNKPPGIK